MEAQLRAGIAELALDLSDGQIGQLLGYAAMLQKWGRVYNLTALLSDQEVVTHHLLDSLAVVNPLRRWGRAASVLDVGSGAGLPGIALAIANPQLRVDCVDAVAKKSAFINQVAGALGVNNARGIHARVEAVDSKYDLVTSRAFASLCDFTGLTQDRLAESGVWMAMKGKNPASEIEQLPASVSMFHVEQLQVPGLDAERCLVWMRRAAA